jgi:hypothetical protein
MRFLASILTLALWCASIVAAHSGALTIADKSVFHAQRRDTVFMLIDLWPQHQVIEALPASERDKTLLDTAYAEAKMVLAKPGPGQIEKVRVEFGYIKNMDEYARQDFSSMVRHGYVVLQKKGADLIVSENKLVFVGDR